MITRKRARADGVRAASPHTQVRHHAQAAHCEQTSCCTQLSSESEDASAVEFEDFFSVNGFSWNLDDDDDGLSPLLDLGPNESADERAEVGATDSAPRVQLSPSRSTGGAVQKSLGCGDAVPPRMNKNAIAARMNRLRKKEYVNGLEKKVGTLVSENSSLRQENTHLGKRVQELEDETRYLRAVLANESMLAQLLSRLSGVNGMKLSTSLFQEPNKCDHDYALPRKRVKVEEKETSGGVCLHVDKNHVSVEFCSKCAESASASLKM